MVSISNADKALKTFYLGVLADQLNVGVNPLLAKIGQTSADVWGKEIKKLAPYGINGGIGSGAETDSLPISGGNNYAEFTLGLKNLYGQIEITDKAIRASQNSVGAFVNLLNAEMEGLLKASKFNFGRMLFGDGSGLLATTVANGGTAKNKVYVDSVKNLIEGMTVDVYNTSASKVDAVSGARILTVDRANKIVTLSKSAGSVIGANYTLYVQGSKGNELTGLEAIFGTGNIYGLNRSDYSFLTPYVKEETDGVTASAIQSAIDAVEENAGSAIDFIVCSYDVRKAYVDGMSANRTNLDYMTLDGGYKALSYAGIPVVADRFVKDGTMYLLNSADFKLHQLCDWRWIEGESGSVLHQVAGKAAYTATLVKYADLLCERPMGQAKITFKNGGGSGSTGYYTVTFDSNGGSDVASQIVLPGGHPVKPTDPTRATYSFTGWKYNGTSVNFSEFTVNSDVTFVAQWA